ncbi:uncharacterized protein LACBIDRAFT_332197 [Laccaria bicolor S238N-H82]|nr:uncharacterized protein LACBIDRAFT_332197 [Laccaria bicolor S238N-H82]EDR02600.1 predicted protein [Laccaria bicolor S238N-H82]|eukprot:XP_001886644.1 predicted protein [Laccaria bicolor S238N-H82]
MDEAIIYALGLIVVLSSRLYLAAKGLARRCMLFVFAQVELPGPDENDVITGSRDLGSREIFGVRTLFLPSPPALLFALFAHWSPRTLFLACLTLTVLLCPYHSSACSQTSSLAFRWQPAIRALAA